MLNFSYAHLHMIRVAIPRDFSDVVHIFILEKSLASGRVFAYFSVITWPILTR